MPNRFLLGIIGGDPKPPPAAPAVLTIDGNALLLNVFSGLVGTLSPQPASLSGTILVDPQNLSGSATDTSPPTVTFAGFTGPVFKSWAGLVAAWGTFFPLFTVTTNIVFVSSHVDDTDPVLFWPIAFGPITVSIQGSAPTTVTAGVALAGTVAKNRAGNQLLNTNLGATGAVGQLVQNTTHASRAWSYKSLGANVFAMSQPLIAAAINGTTSPAEVDTWANGDNVNLLSPIAVNLVSFEPVLETFNAAFTTGFGIYQMTVFSPNGAASLRDICALGAGVQAFECNFQRGVLPQSVTNTSTANAFTNCFFFQGGMNGVGSNVLIVAGALAGTLGANFQNGIVTVDGDFIVGTQSFWTNCRSGVNLVALDGVTLVLGGGTAQMSNGAYGTSASYGAGAGANIDVRAMGHFQYPSTAVAHLLAAGQVTSSLLNSVGNASSHSNANNPDVINSAITLTPAHLDAAQGLAGFGGVAFQLGGATMSATLP